jgi:uncharacterized membrane protein required for colicin V production
VGGLPSLTPLDAAVLAILLVAIARGFLIGLIREGFSIAALGAACVAVGYGTAPAARWLQDATRGEIGGVAAPWIAGAVIGVLSIAVVTFAGRILRRGARMAGLGWADRMGGGVLGAAEGALVGALAVLVVTWIVGRDHPVVAGSRSLETVEELQAYLDQQDELPAVAAPGPR